MVTVYLTITICMVSSPGVCKDYHLQSRDASIQQCAFEGMSQTMKILKKEGENWQIKNWRCSHKRPDLGV